MKKDNCLIRREVSMAERTFKKYTMKLWSGVNRFIGAHPFAEQITVVGILFLPCYRQPNLKTDSPFTTNVL